MATEFVDEHVQCVRPQEVVTVQKQDGLPLCLRHAAVAGNSRACVGLPNKVKCIPKRRNHCFRLVRRPIINNDAFPIGVGLAENTVQGFVEQRRSVVGRDNKRNQHGDQSGDRNRTRKKRGGASVPLSRYSTSPSSFGAYPGRLSSLKMLSLPPRGTPGPLASRLGGPPQSEGCLPWSDA